MKVETTVALSEDLARQGEDAGDLEIINANSAELDEEAADVLEYQVIP